MGKDIVISDSIYSVIYRIFAMIANYIYIGLIVRNLGAEKYGIWAVLLSIVTWIEVLDLGLGHGLRNYLSINMGHKEANFVKSAISTTYFFLIFVGFSLLIILEYLTKYISWGQWLGYNKGDENLLYIMQLFFAFIILHLVLSLCKSFLHSIQKTRITFLMSLLVNGLNLLSVLFMYDKCSVLRLVIAYGINLNLVDIIISVYIFILYPQYIPSLNTIVFENIRPIIKNGIMFFVLQISACVLNWTDSLIISRYFGSMSVTPYSLLSKIFMLPIGLSLCAFTPLWSAFTRAMTRKNKIWIKETINKFYAFFCIIVVGILILGVVSHTIIRIWAGYSLKNENHLIVQIVLFAILRIWCSFYGQIANGLELMRGYLLLSVLQAVVNLPLSVFLAKTLEIGICGVVLGTNIVLLIGAIYMPLLVAKGIANI